jgi:hypothetical protein
MKTSAICLLVIALVVISVANAQIPKAQPPANQFLKDLDSSVPVRIKATEKAVAAPVSALAKPETAEKMARYVKNFQNAPKFKHDGIRTDVAIPPAHQFFVRVDRQFALPYTCQIGLDNSAGAKKKGENQDQHHRLFHNFSV